MSADIAQAAISYFGLPEGTTLVEGGPVGAFAFIIPLTEEHLRGIADRMKVMDEPIEQVVFTPSEMKTREQLRAEYNALSPQQRARFGSFGRFESQALMGVAGEDAIEPSEGEGGRKVQHVDAPVEEESGLPDAVWVPGYALDASQILMASDHNVTRNRYLVQVAMLNDTQRAKYAKGGA